MRLRDLTAPLWLPVDWLLPVETRTHGLITLTVGAQVVYVEYVEYEDGFHALVTEGWGWCVGTQRRRRRPAPGHDKPRTQMCPPVRSMDWRAPTGPRP
ncbi:hypothetical protein SAMN04487983_101987 [Streptomyces sp. yr375]|nr:hypothetical protein SAMN04487983_101987 [Streptomyces sp. yr375]